MNTLNDIIEGKAELTFWQYRALCALLGKRCRQDTRARIRRKLEYPRSLPTYGIFNRVHIEEDCVSYCAGQSYPDEIRTVRNLILKG